MPGNTTSTAGMMAAGATYEQAVASSRELSMPDKVQWDESNAFRGNPYRSLRHQRGIVGYVSVRLIEARQLSREIPADSGGETGKKKDPISSYAVFQLSSDVVHKEDAPNNDEHTTPSTVGDTQKNGVRIHQISDQSKISSAAHLAFTETEQRYQLQHGGSMSETYRSSVIPDNSNPTWTTTRDGESSFSIPLRKGLVRPEGSAVYLNVEMREIERGNLLFSSPDISLGKAQVNLAPLLFGREGVLDIWVNLKGGGKEFTNPVFDTQCAVAASAASLFQSEFASSANRHHKALADGGRVRLLIAYEPRGLQPREGDVVCLEAFARSPTNLIISPLAQPMKVLNTRADYLLVQYRMSRSNSVGNRFTNGQINVGPDRQHAERHRVYGRMKLHRNTLFVIERFSLVDGVVDLAMKPVDAIGQIPVVRWVGDAVGPYAGAVGDLTMPAVLSAKLIFAAARTTTNAGLTGVATTGKVLLAAVAAGKRNEERNNNEDGFSHQNRGRGGVI